MPIWHVHEPFINLWLTDSPLGYQPALGHWISFRLAYKEHDEDSNLDPDVYSLGSGMNSSLILSHIYSITDYRYGAIDATVYFPGGGNDYFNFNNGVVTSYFNNDSLQAFTDGNNHVTGFQLTRPDGSSYTYSLFRSQADGTWTEVYLTQYTDAKGYTTTYNYATYDPDTMVVRLNSITDPDRHNVTLFYLERWDVHFSSVHRHMTVIDQLASLTT